MKDLVRVDSELDIPEIWDYEISVKKVRNLSAEVRDKGAEVVLEIARAHFILTEDSMKKINRKWPDKTFETYCNEIGIDHDTANRWFAKYLPDYYDTIKRISVFKEIPLLPEGKFSVIVIDPPWPYGTVYNPESRRVASPYPEMGLDELGGLNIPCADDCILWLWVTNAFMHDAYHLLEVWEFEPKAILTWYKEKTGVGHWLRGQTEHCILAVKGKPIITHIAQGTFISEKAGRHSQKPDKFYDLVESLCLGKKLEMFARRRRDGWESWGNEVNL